MALDNSIIEEYQLKLQKPIEICRHCIDCDTEPIFFKTNDWYQFNARYCITNCDNNFVPKYLPQEQVIKYLKEKINEM